MWEINDKNDDLLTRLTHVSFQLDAINDTATVTRIYHISLRTWTDRPEQTMKTQIRRRIMRRLIGVCIVCHSSDYF